MDRLQEYLNVLTQKYAFGKSGVIDSALKTLTINGKTYKMLPKRRERRFIEMKALLNDGSVENPCSFRIAHTDAEGEDVFKIAVEEIDLCEYLLDSPVGELFAVTSQNACNALLKTKSGVVCTLELAGVLKNGEKPVDKHEIIAKKGIVCDLSVDTQVRQSSIYVYGKENAVYTDTDFELYGLCFYDAATVRQALMMINDESYAEEIQKAADRAEYLAEKLKESAKTLVKAEV